MRVSKTRYESAKKELGKLKDRMRKYEETVRRWESAMKEVGDVGTQEVIAITINEDGSVSIEARPNGKPEAEK